MRSQVTAETKENAAAQWIVWDDDQNGTIINRIRAVGLA